MIEYLSEGLRTTGVVPVILNKLEILVTSAPGLAPAVAHF